MKVDGENGHLCGIWRTCLMKAEDWIGMANQLCTGTCIEYVTMILGCIQEMVKIIELMK